MPRKFALGMQEIAGILVVKYDDGTFGNYNAYKLAKDWLRMSNDSFYSVYGFNYVPSQAIQNRAKKELGYR